MYRRLKITVAVLFVILIIACGGAGAIWWRWAGGAKAHGGSEVPAERFTVPANASVDQIAAELEKKGLIRSSVYFQYIGRDSAPKPGVYLFSPSEPPARILRRLAAGDVATVKVTFPEGWTIKTMARRLKRYELIADVDAFVQRVTTQGDAFHAPFPLPKNLEGYLFPDTYRFPVGVTEDEIVQRMLDNFDKRVYEPNKDALAKSGRSLADVMNIAAMIEKEAETEPDRPRIASVIYNRLAKKMRLQIDATIQYARGFHEARLLNSALEVDSPYNTYKHDGLPPGPICCPGLPSIEAALHPAKTDFLFYVDSGEGTGAHLFAKTWPEHQHNVAIFHQRRKANPPHPATVGTR